MFYATAMRPVFLLIRAAAFIAAASPLCAAKHPVFGSVNDGPEVTAKTEAARKLVIGPDGKPTGISDEAEKSLTVWWHALTGPAKTGDFADEAMWTRLQMLIAHPVLGRAMAVYMSAQDQPEKAWKILCDLHMASQSQVEKYPLVAVAFALTHDDTHNFVNHRPQAPRDKRVIGKETVTERFNAYLKDAAEGKLAFDPAKLSFTKLKFVVGHDLPFSEIEWARKNITLQPSTLGRKTFYSIKYDHQRLKDKRLSWPHSSEYSLSAIKSSGGICADQAYYGVMAGKAAGIPTMYFHGDGQRGGHAWLGSLKALKVWDFDDGRYAYDNYTVGNTLDPQTGHEITDAWLDYFAADIEGNREFPQAALLLKWVQADPATPGAKELMQAVLRWLPDFLPAWRELGGAMKDKPAFEQDQFWKAWLAHFVNSAEITHEGFKGYYAFLESQKRTADLAALRKRMMESNLKGRIDLRIRMARFITQRLVEGGDMAEASRVADTAITKLADKNRGMIVSAFLEPVVDTMVKAGQSAAASAMLDVAEKKLPSSSDEDLKPLRQKCAAK